MSAVLLLAVAAAVSFVGVVGASPLSGAQNEGTTTTLPGVGDTIPPPEVTIAEDGLSATTGTTTLSATATSDLPAAGSTISVSGTGYDSFKGIYLALCVVPEDGELPSPCGGGADMSGASGSSIWISSNPPPYGKELAIPYGPAGDFAVDMAVSAELNDEFDCREVQCAIVSRNDHIRTSDRSQDIFLPVTFAGSQLEPAAQVEADESAATEGDVASSDAASSDDGGGSATGLLLGAGAVAVLAVAAGGIAMARRSSSGA